MSPLISAALKPFLDQPRTAFAVSPLAGSALKPFLDQYIAIKPMADQLAMLDAHLKASPPAAAQASWSRRGRVVFQCYMVVRSRFY